MKKIQFNYINRKFSYNKKTELKKFIEFLFEQESRQLASLHYIFCSDNYLITINRSFLHHDNYTDIITFDLSESKSTVVGEIYISIDRVKENAAKFNVPIMEEMLRVIFHGALHLCGYLDKKPKDILIMRKQEEAYMQMFLNKKVLHVEHKSM